MEFNRARDQDHVDFNFMKNVNRQEDKLILLRKIKNMICFV